MTVAPPTAEDISGVDATGASAASKNRQGNSGRKVGQSESSATLTDPLVERQSSCCTTRDGKPGQKHSRGRPDYLEYPTKETERRLLAAATGLPPPTPAAHLQPQEKRQKAPARYS